MQNAASVQMNVVYATHSVNNNSTVMSNNNCRQSRTATVKVNFRNGKALLKISAAAGNVDILVIMSRVI